jgi:hypothetical protein
VNLILKAKIIEKFGTQADFAIAVKDDETLVSRVVRRRRFLTPEKQRQWAKILKCDPKRLFQNSDLN